MGAAEKILEQIESEAKATATTVLAEAEEQVSTIEADSQESAKKLCIEATTVALKNAEAIKANAESNAELIVRDARLKRKRKEISKIVDKAVEALTALDDEKYFTVLAKMAAGVAESQKGTVLLSKNDANRNISVFEKKLKDLGVNADIDSNMADIKSGFVLKYGDIELNLSFESLVREKKEQLEDAINKILFAD